MKIKHLLLAAASAGMIAMAGAPTAAQAEIHWTFIYTATTLTGPQSADLTFFTDSTKNAFGGYNIDNVTGTIDGDAITGLACAPSGTPPAQGTSCDGAIFVDNDLWKMTPTTGPFSNNGPYVKGSGAVYYNLFMPNASGGVEAPGSFPGPVEILPVFHNQAGNFVTYGDASTSPFYDLSAGVPEPATWAMMLIGFGGLGALLRQKRQQLASAGT